MADLEIPWLIDEEGEYETRFIDQDGNIIAECRQKLRNLDEPIMQFNNKKYIINNIHRCPYDKFTSEKKGWQLVMVIDINWLTGERKTLK